MRFQTFGADALNRQTGQLYGIPSLLLILVVLLLSLLIGVTVAFIGLTLHNERRYHERLAEAALRENVSLAAASESE